MGIRSRYLSLNEKEQVQILQARKEGITYGRIAGMLNCSETFVRKFCYCNGFKKNPYHKGGRRRKNGEKQGSND